MIKDFQDGSFDYFQHLHSYSDTDYIAMVVMFSILNFSVTERSSIYLLIKEETNKTYSLQFLHKSVHNAVIEAIANFPPGLNTFLAHTATWSEERQIFTFSLTEEFFFYFSYYSY